LVDLKLIIMRKLLFTLLAFNCIVIFGQTTDKPASTTEEEYNYLTKGYKVQIESGLDMKKGYVFQDFAKVTRGKYDFDFKLLYREGKKEIAGYLVITHSRISGKTYYNCIPINNPELLERYYNDIYLWDSGILAQYCYVISGFLGTVTSSANELDKQSKK
jgi:hypothetical protein